MEQKIFPGHDDADLDGWISKFIRPVVFTNGCFDILHRGHVACLETAAKLGESLIVGVNSDDSVRRLGKGPNRPLNTLEDRMAVLAALECIRGVIAYNEDTPAALIAQIKPEVLVKGGDWKIADIAGGDEVKRWGGEVHSIAFEYQRSTSSLIEKIRNS